MKYDARKMEEGERDRGGWRRKVNGARKGSRRGTKWWRRNRMSKKKKKERMKHD